MSGWTPTLALWQTEMEYKKRRAPGAMRFFGPGVTGPQNDRGSWGRSTGTDAGAERRPHIGDVGMGREGCKSALETLKATSRWPVSSLFCLVGTAGFEPATP